MNEMEIHGIAHITGGGLYENIPRIIPEGLCASIETKEIRIPSIMLELEKEEILHVKRCTELSIWE